MEMPRLGGLSRGTLSVVGCGVKVRIGGSCRLNSTLEAIVTCGCCSFFLFLDLFNV
jgi:hypothetical protein